MGSKESVIFSSSTNVHASGAEKAVTRFVSTTKTQCSGRMSLSLSSSMMSCGKFACLVPVFCGE